VKLLIIGGSGLLGGKLTLLAKAQYEVYSTYCSRPFNLLGVKTLPLDLARGGDTLTMIKEVKPDWVVLTSAVTNVDLCETMIDRTEKINGIAPGYVASACEDIGAHLVHISTDYVFDGESEKPYTEEDEPRPTSIYGSTKLEGEHSAQHNCTNPIIIRSSVVYGWPQTSEATRGSDLGKTYNFATWIIAKLRKTEHVKIVTDQVSTPTLADNLAEAILEAMSKDYRGVLHISGTSCIDRHQFALKIAHTFNLDESLISPCNTEELGLKASRPKNSCLNTSKAQQLLQTRLLNPDEGLDTMKDQSEKERA